MVPWWNCFVAMELSAQENGHWKLGKLVSHTLGDLVLCVTDQSIRALVLVNPHGSTGVGAGGRLGSRNIAEAEVGSNGDGSKGRVWQAQAGRAGGGVSVLAADVSASIQFRR